MIVEYIKLTVKLLTGIDDFSVTASDSSDGGVLYLISVPQEDAGRVIGKYGDTIKALRSLVFAMTVLHFKRRSAIVVSSPS